MNDDQRRYLESLRQAAASAQSLEALHNQIDKTLRGMTLLGEPNEAQLTKNERAHQFVRQLGSVHAAQATAYENMIADGGPENSRAYVEYEAATLRNTALLPRDKLGQD